MQSIQSLVGQTVPMTGGELAKLRLHLGVSQAELEGLLLMGAENPTGRTIRRYEAKPNDPVPGPVSLAVDAIAAKMRQAARSKRELTMSQDDVPLEDGQGHHMGGGVFIVFQEVDGVINSAVLTPDDLRKMLNWKGQGTPTA